ncbi:MAG: KEOPS complex N(6)-L-threonylcarbamoyladenine synthase Kae1 [Nanoarchaeota archaeon]
MISLGIESSAHTFSVSLVNDKGKILSEKRDMYTREDGGIIPSEAAKHHINVREKLLEECFKEANLTFKDINIISFASGPGLAPCLLAGMEFAKKLAKENNIILVPVNHLIAHLEIGKLFSKAKDPVFILATGANTQIIAFEEGRYRIFGETLDTGIGNMLDKFGRAIGLGFPAGSKIEQLAKSGKYIDLGYVVKGMDLSFSGILTKAIDLYKKGYSKEDLCYSLQETYFSMLTEVTERAMAHVNKKEALLIGGVAANKRLIEMINIMCKERKAKFFYVPLKYSGDQAAMIAYTGILQYKSNKKYDNNLDKIDINPNWRVEQVEVSWL